MPTGKILRLVARVFTNVRGAALTRQIMTGISGSM
jgi:hypothetical protein